MKPHALVLRGLFGLAALVLVAGAVWLQREQTAMLRHRAEQTLLSIADLKVRQLSAWRAERLADGDLYRETPSLAVAFTQWLAEPRAERAAVLQNRLERRRRVEGYAQAFFTDVHAQVRLTVGPNLPSLPLELLLTLTNVLRTGETALTELFRWGADPLPNLAVVAPLVTGEVADAAVVGAVVLVTRASDYVYPLLLAWPLPSQTAETLLVRRRGEDVLFLNDPRDWPGSALQRWLPVSEGELVEVQAVQGARGLIEGRDYRGEAVVAAAAQVPGSSWVLVAKMDAREAYGAARRRAVAIWLGTGALLGLLGLVAWNLWQRVHAQQLRQLLEAERERRRLEERHQVTLASIGDAVIVADAEGRVEFLNPVAEGLTGWPLAEARGKPLSKVFHIVNEETRQVVESPVSRVLREGRVVGLANHTLLIARDGREYPIADSGAPIRDEEGRITGVVLVFRDQTEERKAQRLLAEALALNEAIVATLRHPLLVLDQGLRIVSANRAFYQSFRSRPETVVGQSLYALWGGALEQPQLRQLLEQILPEDTRLDDFELKVSLPELGPRILRLNARRLYGEARASQMILLALEDVTEAVQAREALAESHRQMRTLLANLQGMAYRCVNAPDWPMVLVSDGCADLTGYPAEALLQGRPRYGELILPEDRQAVWDVVQAALAQQEPFELTYRIQRADGQVRWVWERGRGVYDDSGALKFLEGFVADITPRKEAEEALFRSRERLRITLESIGDAVLTTDAEGRVEYLNPVAEQLTGWKREEAEGKRLGSVFRIINEFSRQPVENPVERVLREGRVVGLANHTLLLSRDGREIPIADSAAPIRDAQGRLAGVVLVFRDQTAERQARRAIEESEARFRSLFQGAGEMIVLHQLVRDADGRPVDYRILDCNPAFERIMGLRREEVRGRLASEVYGTTPPPFLEEFSAVALHGRPTRMGVYWPPVDRHFEVSVAPFGPDGFATLTTDVTDRKRAEAELSASEQRFRMLSEHALVGIYLFDEERFLYVNPALARIFGYAPEELVGKLSPLDLTYPEDRARVQENIRRRLKGEVEQVYYRFRGQRKDGSTIHLEAHGARVEYMGRPAILGTLQDVTERQQWEEKLANERALLRTLVDHLPVALYLKDTEGRKTLVNPVDRLNLGVTTEAEALGKTDFDFFPPDQAAAFWEDDQKVLRSGEPVLNREERLTRPDGSEVWLLTSKVPLRDAQGRIIGLAGIGLDITELKRARDQLAAERTLLRTLLQTLPLAVYAKDITGRKTLTNPVDLQFMGARSEEEVLGKSDFDFYPPEQAEVFAAEDRQVLESGEPILGREDRIVLRDGREAWLLTYKVPLRDAQGRVIGLAGCGLDITDRKRAEEALIRERTLLRAIVNTVPMVVYAKDLQGRKTLTNPEDLRYMGARSEEEVLGKTDFDFYPPEQAAVFAEEDRRVLETGQPILNYEERVVLRDGSIAWKIASKVPLRDPQGRIIGLCGCGLDITERKRAEARLQEQATLLDAANDAILVWTLDRRIRYCNASAARLLGRDREALVGLGLEQVPELLFPGFSEAEAALQREAQWTGEFSIPQATGGERIVLARWTLLREPPDTPPRVLAILTDITERKQMQAQLLHAQRMQGIGALAGGIAHDLNNLLAPILMAAPLLKETVEDPESRAMLETMEQCAQRGADIIRQLLTFARGTPGTRVPVPVRHLLRDMEKIIRETFPRNIQTELHAPRELWSVMGDPTQLHQALMNLCVNARDAMPQGGILRLAAENVHVDESFASLDPRAKPGPYVCLTVSDTGTGIAPEIQDRIFDPFFTTKEVGKGTGLGLPTVLGIVQGHNGFLRFKSLPGQGTTFELYFPATISESAAEEPAEPPLPPPARGEMVLVVDDEASVRDMLKRTLEKHGYRVLLAAEGNEALALVERYASEVRLVLTDMLMPGLDGPGLVQALRARGVRLPILGMTGVAERVTIRNLENLELETLMTKPFLTRDLLWALHRALEPGPSGSTA
ncbi:PAS domain S-box protein [Limisphaera sp. VF-2]|jgi:PAS domain S-box-containing protein|uniref:PAS domain S-box protein n=1 Tax=Limisphaera sp. VF-2 TaxID=3400418 RepID=UPI001774FBAC